MRHPAVCSRFLFQRVGNLGLPPLLSVEQRILRARAHSYRSNVFLQLGVALHSCEI